MYRRAVVTLLVILAANAAIAQIRGRATEPIPMSGDTVSGFVTGVSGNLISLGGGLVVIDASHAKVSGTIKAGSLIFAILSSSNVAANASLPAATIAVTDIPDVTLTGPVQVVDAAGKTLTLLGRVVHVDSGTSFGGGHDVKGLTDVAVNDRVEVQASAGGGALTATRILVFAVVVPAPVLIHGTVKSIGTSSWVITDASGKDVTVVINAQTKIVGNPKVGDSVDVLANLDSANNYVAVSIIVSVPPPQVRLSGVVKQINATNWIIGPAVGMGPDFIVQVNAQTKIIGDPKVGDHVDVVVQPTPSGFVAVSITRT